MQRHVPAGKQRECLFSVHRQSGGIVVDENRYIGEHCGDSTGAVLGPGVRGLRVLAPARHLVDSRIQFGRASVVFTKSS